MLNEAQNKVVKEALTWDQVPYHHQGLGKFGVDCIGLINMIGINAGVSDVDVQHREFKKYYDYERDPNPVRMRQFLDEFYVKIWIDEDDEDAEFDNNLLCVGDILWIYVVKKPRHVMLYMPGNNVIHAHSKNRKVVHHSWSGVWTRAKAIYRFTGLV